MVRVRFGVRFRVMVRFRVRVSVRVSVNYFRDSFSIITACTALLHVLTVR